jgi:hypothetical protein
METQSCILNNDLVNKFSNFLCSEISENKKFKTRITVTDIGTFFIIKGITENKNKKEIRSICEKFIETEKTNYTDLKSINFKTLDIIEYGSPESFEFSGGTFTYSWSTSTNEPSISISSKIPNGWYDNGVGKCYKYIQNVCELSKPYFKFENIILEFEVSSSLIEIKSLSSDSYYSNSKLLSILKDNFDGEIDLDKHKLMLNVI